MRFRSALFLVASALACFPALAPAQFVRPKPEYHKPEPGLYVEDPFIVKYRQEFFSVFRGDFARFEKAYAEIEEMTKKDPQDARAWVWLGNGKTVKAGILMMGGKATDGISMLAESRKLLDKAVDLKPEDPNIYMMRAATLYIQGQYTPAEHIPKSVWEKLRDDCNKFISFLGDRMPRASIHLRGETYGELGIAYLKLGEKEKAKEAFKKILELCPGTTYAERAQKEIDALTMPPESA